MVRALFFPFFISLNSQTSDSFVNHFDGHSAYLKILDFFLKVLSKSEITSVYIHETLNIHRM